MTSAILAIVILSALPTRAETVTPALVCQVQNAIRFRESAWPVATCERVATALNSTPRPRTTLAVAIIESDLRPLVVATTRPGVHDVGLMGVRCVALPSGGACLFGPARGYAVEELKDLEINVRVAAAIMAQKKAAYGKHWMRAYNGGTREHGYARNIAAIEKALDGKQVRVKNPRVRKMVRQIAESVNHG